MNRWIWGKKGSLGVWGCIVLIQKLLLTQTEILHIIILQLKNCAAWAKALLATEGGKNFPLFFVWSRLWRMYWMLYFQSVLMMSNSEKPSLSGTDFFKLPILCAVSNCCVSSTVKTDWVNPKQNSFTSRKNWKRLFLNP